MLKTLVLDSCACQNCSETACKHRAKLAGLSLAWMGWLLGWLLAYLLCSLLGCLLGCLLRLAWSGLGWTGVLAGLSAGQVIVVGVARQTPMRPKGADGKKEPLRFIPAVKAKLENDSFRCMAAALWVEGEGVDAAVFEGVGAVAGREENVAVAMTDATVLSGVHLIAADVVPG